MKVAVQSCLIKGIQGRRANATNKKDHPGGQSFNVPQAIECISSPATQATADVQPIGSGTWKVAAGMVFLCRGICSAPWIFYKAKLCTANFHPLQASGGFCSWLIAFYLIIEVLHYRKWPSSSCRGELN